MVILVNASSLIAGGGLQVADSICRELYRYPQHYFVVVLSSFFQETIKAIKEYPNVEVHQYDVPKGWYNLLFGRDAYLDKLVDEKKVDAVLTVFGPSRWSPRCKHLCGFARAQMLLRNPLQKRQSLKEKLIYQIWKFDFKRNSKVFYTENSYISSMLPNLLGNVDVYTVSNYYNQIFDQPENWIKNELPVFDGITLLTVSSSYPHKNLEMAATVTRILEQRHPLFKFRFVFTIDRNQYKVDISGIEEHFVFLGKVGVSECPSLYQQCDIVFQPTLMECFTATYPEAMRMEKPIITTDLEFAHSLCHDAACYFDAVDAESAAEAIYKVANEKDYAAQLVAYGKKQLRSYNNYEQRAEKLIKIIEEL